MHLPIWARSALLAAVAAAAVAAAFAVLSPQRDAGRAHYEVPPAAVIGVLLATFTATFGALLIAWRFPGRIALLSALSTALFLLAVLTMFTIGLVLLLASLALMTVTATAMRGHDLDHAAGSAVSGALVAIGLIVVCLAIIQSPVVECLPDGGVRSSSHYWWGGGPASSSGSGTVGTDGTASGTMTSGDTIIRYVCQDGQLVEFERLGGK